MQISKHRTVHTLRTHFYNKPRRLSKINVRKAPGPDGIPNWVLRDFCPYLSGPVCAIFNASIREGFVPIQWKEANIISVLKVSLPQSIKFELRPISLTSTLGKVLHLLVFKSCSTLAARLTAASLVLYERSRRRMLWSI